MESNALQMFNATIRYADDTIFVQPVCDFFKINAQNQYRVINKDAILRTERIKKSSKSIFDDERPRLTLSRRGFIRWIQLLNPQIVHVSLRGKLIEYQTLIFDFLFGKVEREEEIKTVVKRRDKLKRLKSIISAELNACQERIESYITGRFNQSQLNFSAKAAIDEHSEEVEK